MVTIRDAHLSDAPVVAEFNARLATESEDRSLDPQRLIPGVEALLAHPESHGRYFLAEHGEGVVGQLAITYEWSDWRNGWFWWFQSVYVVPEARRAGVFSALYRHVESLARSRDDVCGLRLYVRGSNESARQTYLVRGMRRSGYEVLELDFSSRASADK